MEFFDRLTETCEKKDSLLCIGLDPRPGEPGSAEDLLELNRRIIGETAEYAACFKPNIAFYEAYGPKGLEALVKSIELIPEGTRLLIDAKRNDIGSTAEAYARSLYGFYGADAVTHGSYMGRTSVEPFLSYHDRGVFILCRTSNPGADRLQDLRVVGAGGEEGEELYLRVARECTSWGPQIGLVVAGNDPVALRRIRSAFPDVWILAPGIGAQGGTMEEAMEAGVRGDGLGILPVVVRSIANDPDPGSKAREYRDEINRVRSKAMETAPAGRSGASTAPRSPSTDATQLPSAEVERRELLRSLIETGCFRIGEFVLKSGVTSPFYVDLRRASSDPQLLRRMARAYASMLRGLRCDRIAGIPVAALPFAAALSLEMGIPLIYPRSSSKGHGTGNTVEGNYEIGERVVLVDDLITRGDSKLEAAHTLEAQGLEVRDLVVFLERGKKGRTEVERDGLRLHAYAHITDLLQLSREMGLINEEQLGDFSRFANESP